MSYALAPARCVASKNGDFRYQGPKNKVLWPSLRGMSSPLEDWGGSGHRLLEDFCPQQHQLAAGRIQNNRISFSTFGRGPPPGALGATRRPRAPFGFSRGWATPATSRSRSDRD